MDLPTYVKNIYPHTNAKNELINNQADFMGELFYAAGNEDLTGKDSSYLCKIYRGDVALSIKIKKNTLFNRENLTAFLSESITDNVSIETIMRNFGISGDMPSSMDRDAWKKNKAVFIDVLCTQFQLIISEREKTVTDIVATEYLRLLSTVSVESVVETMSQIEQKELISDLNQLRTMLPALKQLVKILESTNHYVPARLSVYVFFYDESLHQAVEDFKFHEVGYEKCRSDYFNTIDYGQEIHIPPELKEKRSTFRKTIYRIFMLGRKLEYKEGALSLSENAIGGYSYTKYHIDRDSEEEQPSNC